MYLRSLQFVLVYGLFATAAALAYDAGQDSNPGNEIVVPPGPKCFETKDCLITNGGGRKCDIVKTKAATNNPALVHPVKDTACGFQILAGIQIPCGDNRTFVCVAK